MFVILSYTESSDTSEPIRVEVVHLCTDHEDAEMFISRSLNTTIRRLNEKNIDVEYEIINLLTNNEFRSKYSRIDFDNQITYARGIDGYEEYFVVIEKKMKVSYCDTAYYPDEI